MRVGHEASGSRNGLNSWGTGITETILIPLLPRGVAVRELIGLNFTPGCCAIRGERECAPRRWGRAWFARRSCIAL